MSCYKKGSCGPYEMYACNECPASKPEYRLKENNIDIFVATLNGNIKDNYMAIGCSATVAKQNVINLFFKDKCHKESDLPSDIYITLVSFPHGVYATVF